MVLGKNNFPCSDPFPGLVDRMGMVSSGGQCLRCDVRLTVSCVFAVVGSCLRKTTPSTKELNLEAGKGDKGMASGTTVCPLPCPALALLAQGQFTPLSVSACFAQVSGSET